MRTYHAPAALRPGSHLRCIAPSGPFDVAQFERGLALLGTRYRVSHRDDILARHRGFLAGDDARRLAEIHEALEDPGVEALVAVRGGYGASRLLERLDPALVRQAGKLLVGFSDITALHALWARAGLRSLHAPMVAALGRSTGALWDRWIEAVEGGLGAPMALTPVADGMARGPLTGGNLSVLAALAGTPHAPPLDGAILFLEDVNEAPYRLDRMLTTLRQAGWLARCAGVLVGALDDGAGTVEHRAGAEAVLADRLADLGIPVASGLLSGHIEDNLPLALGATVELAVRGGSARVTFLDGAVARPGSGGVV
jgi:muramoyltetrapeptide carboxypeptidase